MAHEQPLPPVVEAAVVAAGGHVPKASDASAAPAAHSASGGDDGASESSVGDESPLAAALSDARSAAAAAAAAAPLPKRPHGIAVGPGFSFRPSAPAAAVAALSERVSARYAARKAGIAGADTTLLLEAAARKQDVQAQVLEAATQQVRMPLRATSRPADRESPHHFLGRAFAGATRRRCGCLRCRGRWRGGVTSCRVSLCSFRCLNALTSRNSRRGGAARPHHDGDHLCGWSPHRGCTGRRICCGGWRREDWVRPQHGNGQS